MWVSLGAWVVCHEGRKTRRGCGQADAALRNGEATVYCCAISCSQATVWTDRSWLSKTGEEEGAPNLSRRVCPD